MPRFFYFPSFLLFLFSSFLLQYLRPLLPSSSILLLFSVSSSPFLLNSFLSSPSLITFSSSSSFTFFSIFSSLFYFYIFYYFPFLLLSNFFFSYRAFPSYFAASLNLLRSCFYLRFFSVSFSFSLFLPYNLLLSSFDFRTFSSTFCSFYGLHFQFPRFCLFSNIQFSAFLSTHVYLLLQSVAETPYLFNHSIYDYSIYLLTLSFYIPKPNS